MVTIILLLFCFLEKEVEGIPTVLPLENNPVPASTPKALYSLPNHGKRTVFNDSSDSDEDSKSLNISNGNGQKLESEDMSEKTATVDENNVSMDVSSPIVNGKTKKLAPNQKSISCEDFLLEAEYCEKPNLKVRIYLVNIFLTRVENIANTYLYIIHFS